MPFFEEIAELLHKLYNFLGGYDSSISALGSGWEGFVQWITAWWETFSGFFKTLFQG